jgi:Helix-turn-helix domain
MSKTKIKAKRRRAKAIAESFATTTFLSDDAIAVGALKIPDAATYLSISVITLRRLMAKGLIRPNKVLRHNLLPVSELQRFLQEGMVE